jgi:hypothetical protein
MNTSHKQIADLLLIDPMTDKPLIITSDIKHDETGAYSFEVGETDGTSKWRHIIRTVEIGNE